MDLLEAIQRCIKNNREIVQRIRAMRIEIDSYRKKYLVAKTSGTALGVAGSAGLMFAPFSQHRLSFLMLPRSWYSTQE